MMRSFCYILILLTTLLLPGCAHQNLHNSDPRTMTFAPLEFKIPKADRVVLDNGMVVYLLVDHELPLISMTAYTGTGSAYEPADKVGLAAMTGAVMRSGGVEGMSPEKIDDELEFMASSADCSISTDVGTCAMSTLKKNVDQTLQIFSRVMMTPSFKEDRVEIARKQGIEQVRRQYDDPKQLGDRELNKAIYRNTPLGRVPTIATLKAITRNDLVEFHRKYYRPNNTILAVAGDFDREELLSKLKAAFGTWQKAEVTMPSVPEPKADGEEVLYVPKDVNQTVIRMGHLGIDKSNPDLYAVRVMDSILGSNGFNSRLMAEVRTNQGLAYSVASQFEIGRRFLGTFEAETETKAMTTARTIALMEKIISDMTTAPVTDQELKLAKDSIINSFIFGFTTPAGVVSQLARLEYYSYPPGYLDTYRQRIAAVTRDDVLRVAKKYLHPDQLILVVVGSKEKFDEPLSVFGKVKEIKPENGK